MRDVLPHDLEAEEALLGDLLNLPARVGEVADRVVPGDFHSTLHSAVFAAMVRLHGRGEKPDVLAVVSELEHAGDDFDRTKVGLLSFRGSGAWKAASNRVLSHALRRNVILALARATDEAWDLTTDPAEVAEQTMDELGQLEVPSELLPNDLYTSTQVLERPDDSSPWVVPGMLRRGWRAVLVASEGAGKSELIRQIAVCAASGLHPLTFQPTEPQSVLVVDLENPEESLKASLWRLGTQVTQTCQRPASDVWLWHRPGGVNLRARTDRSQFESVLRYCRPTLVCLGPLYKSYRTNPRENDEQAVGDLQAIFDDLRTRFGFALVLEHHAPHAETSAHREMRPYGSSLWLRWPEFGIGLTKAKENPSWLELKRWRGDRLAATWPERLERGQGWPWIGRYKEGQF